MANLIVPIFSMRSYIDGTYSILKDGNFQLHLNRMQKDDIIVIPNNKNQKDFDELINMGYINKKNIIELQYGINALETREVFWKNNTMVVDALIEYFNLECLITDITGYNGHKPFINNFNITKDPNNPRNYIDKFIDIDIESIKKSIKTFVLNQSQKDYLISLDKSLTNKIKVNQKVINPKFYECFNITSKPNTSNRIHKFGLGYDEIKTIFFPFRLSDDCYKFFEVVKEYHDHYIYITDPNNVYKEMTHANDTNAIYHFTNVIKLNDYLSKEKYYNILATTPTIVYKENPEKVFHPGLAEFIYFNCNIICDHKLPTYNDVVIKNNEDIWQE